VGIAKKVLKVEGQGHDQTVCYNGRSMHFDCVFTCFRNVSIQLQCILLVSYDKVCSLTTLKGPSRSAGAMDPVLSKDTVVTVKYNKKYIVLRRND